MSRTDARKVVRVCEVEGADDLRFTSLFAAPAKGVACLLGPDHQSLGCPGPLSCSSLVLFSSQLAADGGDVSR